MVAIVLNGELRWSLPKPSLAKKATLLAAKILYGKVVCQLGVVLINLRGIHLEFIDIFCKKMHKINYIKP